MDAKMATGLGVLLLAMAPQGGEKVPRPPADAKPLAPVQQPFRTAVERDDLLQQFGPRSPLEGFYKLVSMTPTNARATPAKGYLAMGRQYLSLHLQAMLPDLPAVQSAFRRYRVSGNRITMSSLVGFRNEEGTILIDEEGLVQVCYFRLVGTKLTMRLPGGRVLEFERIE